MGIAPTHIHRADEEEVLTKKKGSSRTAPTNNVLRIWEISIFLTVVVALYKVRQKTEYRIQNTGYRSCLEFEFERFE